MNERMVKEMSECTFAPKVRKKTAVRKGKQLGDSLKPEPTSERK